MSWVRDVCAEHGEAVQACVAHPALERLFANRLPRARFRAFLHQAAIHVREESRVLAAAAGRAPDVRTAARLAGLVRDLHGSECSRHRTLAQHLGDPLDPAAPAVPAPATHACVSHLRSVAFDGGLLEILAAVYPSVWVYTCVGRHFAATRPADPLVHTLLRHYAGDTLDTARTTLGELLDAAEGEATAAAHTAARRAFAVSLHHERRFLDMVLDGECWSVTTE